jgi:hypothetical protein
VAVLGDGEWNASALLSEKEHVVRLKGEIVRGLVSFSREQDKPGGSEAYPEPIEVGMPCNGDVVDIVHRCAAYPTIVPLKAHRFDQVHRGSEAGAKPQNGTYVSRYLRFEKSNSHWRCVAGAGEVFKVPEAGSHARGWPAGGGRRRRTSAADVGGEQRAERRIEVAERIRWLAHERRPAEQERAALVALTAPREILPGTRALSQGNFPARTIT